ncbi:MAG: hypothetical protein OS112_00360 [Methanoregula sp.]|nr:MAG: hypothetical protein OS112_00360 [Methanoregula sp.]
MERAYITNISQRIIQNCNVLGFEPDVDEIERKLQCLVEDFGVQPSEAEKSVTEELIKKHKSLPKKAKILKNFSEYDLHELDDLLNVTKSIDMDINWLMAVASLSAQEIAIKRKLFELTGSYSEGLDFQKTVNALTGELKKRKQKVPNILIIIGRSYSPIRAKILHDPNECLCSKEEADLMVKNTTLLLKTLFKQNILQTDVTAFLKSVNKDSIESKILEFSNFDSSLKKQIFENILEKLSLSYEGMSKYSDHFIFLSRALTSELDIEIQKELLRTILFKSPFRSNVIIKERIMSAISELTYLESIRIDIRNNKLIDSILQEFEDSKSYAIAGINAKIIVDFLSLFDNNQLIRVIDASIKNRQIYESVKAQGYLKQIILSCEDRIPEAKIKKLEKLMDKE